MDSLPATPTANPSPPASPGSPRTDQVYSARSTSAINGSRRAGHDRRRGAMTGPQGEETPWWQQVRRPTPPPPQYTPQPAQQYTPQYAQQYPQQPPSQQPKHS